DRILPGGKSRAQVRKAFRTEVEPVLLEAMLDRKALQEMHPDLDWTKDGGTAAFQQASHQRFIELTEGLGGNDRGRLAEKWYRRVFAPESATQISVSSETLNTLRPEGMKSDQGRRLDMVDADGTVREIKHISGPLSKRDLDQFADMMELVGSKTKLNDPRLYAQHGKKTVTPNRAVVTFTDPKGANANLEWIRASLEGRPELSVH